MGSLIGIDEAGLGPNLGPYVVTATAWETPGSPGDADLWELFREVITPSPRQPDDGRLHVGDSKAVFQPGKGVGALERGVLSALGIFADGPVTTDRALRRIVCGEDGMEEYPWYADNDLMLPLASERDDIHEMCQRWRGVLEMTGVRLTAVRSVILEPRQFNRLIAEHQNKATALSVTSLALLRTMAKEAEPPVVAWCDKHGGRNRYDRLLSECFDGAFVFRGRESAELSVYRLGDLEVRFQPRAEAQFPVAIASMVSKYLRELAMARFNRFWTSRLPSLRPTQGYPVDARRFRDEIASEQRRMGIDDDALWRCR